MKQIEDRAMFVPEFQKLIGSQKFTNMNIDEDENEMVIRLKKQDGAEKKQKKERLLKILEQDGGILRSYPGAAEELHAIARREGEEDREGSQLG